MRHDMDCSVCLNLQDDGLCIQYGKEPPEGFAARCRHYAPDPDAPLPAEPEPEPAPPDGTARLCASDFCPYRDGDTFGGPYCISGVRAEAGGIIVYSHTRLQDDTPCPRNWTA